MRLSYLLAGTSYYWDGVANQFSPPPRSTPVMAWTHSQILAPSGNWTYPPDIVWPVDMSHAMLLEARAEDNASLGDGSGGGNISAVASVNFNVDFIAPSATITWPTANAAVSSGTVQMTGPATDDLSGVNLIQVEISTGVTATAHHPLLDRVFLYAHSNLDQHGQRKSLALYHSIRRASHRHPILPATADNGCCRKSLHNANHHFHVQHDAAHGGHLNT